MDVLIIERDELVGSMLTDALDGEGISAAVLPDQEALKLPPDDSAQVVITRMNRGHNEDLTGIEVVSAMRRKWPGTCAIYFATLWPAHLPCRALATRERFLTKPVSLGKMIQAVRELLDSGICRQPGQLRDYRPPHLAVAWMPYRDIGQLVLHRNADRTRPSDGLSSLRRLTFEFWLSRHRDLVRTEDLASVQ